MTACNGFIEIKQPTIINKFQLIDIGNSKIVSNTLSNQLIKIQQSFVQSSTNKSHSLKHVVTLTFEDAADGTTSEAIKKLAAHPLEVYINIDTFGSILRFNGCKITDIVYELDYAKNSTAQYIVTFDVRDWSRTLN